MDRKGQVIIEYAALFVIIVAVVLYASVHILKPSLNRFFNSSSGVIDNATTTIRNL